MGEDTQADPLRGSVLVSFDRGHFFMIAELPDDTARGRIVSAVVEGLKTGKTPTVADLAERLLTTDLVNDAIKNAKSWRSHSHPDKAGAPLGNDNASKDHWKTIEKQSKNNRETIAAEGNEDEGNEEGKEKTENENGPLAASSVLSGFALKVSDSDAMRVRMLAGEAEAVDEAMKWTGETGSALARNTLVKFRRKLGCEVFADTVLECVAEAKVDGEPRNRGAVLNAKLRRRAD